MEEWAAEGDNYRRELLSLPSEQALARIFYGIGSLSLGELGGERIKVALEANSTEDEHDCFSDNTHWSHYYNGLGISNVYKGEYQRIDGSWVRGPSLSQAVAASSAQADKALTAALKTTMARGREGDVGGTHLARGELAVCHKDDGQCRCRPGMDGRR